MCEDDVEVIGNEFDWSELVWGEQSLTVKGVEGGSEIRISPVKNFKYFQNTY